MRRNQFAVLLSMVTVIGLLGYLSAAMQTFDEKEEGKTGLKSMVSKLNTNFALTKPMEQGRITTVLQTTHTQTFTTVRTAIPYVHLMSGGTNVEAVVTVATNKFTVPLPTNTTFEFIVVGN